MAYGILSPLLMGQPQRLGLQQMLNPELPMGGGVGQGQFPAPPPQGGFPAQQPSYSGGGFFDNLLDPSVALPMAGALMAGPTFGEGMGNAFGYAGKALPALKEKNQTKAYLKANFPELAALADAGAPTAELWKAALRKKGMSGDVTYGLTPQWGLDDQGNPVMGVTGNDGSFKKIDTPGFKISKTPIKIDAADRWILLDPVTRQPIGEIPKNYRGAEAEKAIGENEGKQAAAAAADIQAGQNALNIVDQIRTSSDMDRGTGFSSKLNGIAGTSGYDFQNLVDQAKSGAFLTAIQQMRGLGSLSNAEGSAATAAVARMDTATSKEAFLRALDDYQTIIEQGIAKAQARQAQYGTAVPGAPAAPAAPAAPGGKTSSGVQWSIEP